jgi:hypothetical protein
MNCHTSVTKKILSFVMVRDRSSPIVTAIAPIAIAIAHRHRAKKI